MGEPKIRLGIGLGAQTRAAGFGEAVDKLEANGVDSLWLPEIVYSPAVDPMIGMTHALARTINLKVGTGISVLPGRNPVLVAKQLSTLAGLAPKRVLPVFGLQPARAPERDLFPVPRGRRADVFDESLRLIRLLLSRDEVSFEGEFFSVDKVSLGDRPAKPLDLWLGGSAPAALRRIGRLADGWLGSFLSPEQAGHAVDVIRTAAAEAGREIEADHYGLSVAVAPHGVPDDLAAVARQRTPDIDVSELVPGSWQETRRLLERYIEAGLTKFVLRPAGEIPFDEFLDGFLTEAAALQN